VAAQRELRKSYLYTSYSGLDSESALITVNLLKELCANHDVAAIVIIHQPDGYIFRLFNRLVLVSGGMCIFSGGANDLADIYPRLFGSALLESVHEVPLDILRRLKHISAHTLDFLSVGSDEKRKPIPNNQDAEISVLAQENELSFVRKLFTVLNRNLMNHYVRNVTNLGARLLIYTACSLLDGAIFWKTGNAQGTKAVGAFTFVLLITYLLPFNALPVYFQEKRFFVFERTMGLYSPWIYCICQCTLEAWVVILTATLQTAIIVPMASLWNPTVPRWESFLTHLSGMIASSLTGSGIILFLSMLLPSQDLAFLAGACCTVVSVGLSGGFVPSPDLNDLIT